jgi:ABC-type Na+ efflux pump permease subunit
MKKLLAGLAVFAPTVALADSVNNTFTNLNSAANNLSGFIGNLTKAVNAAVPLLLAVAVVVFIYSVIKYIIGAKGPEERKKNTNLLIWSVVAIAVILALFGLAQFLTGFFGINTGGINSSELPSVNTNTTTP